MKTAALAITLLALASSAGADASQCAAPATYDQVCSISAFDSCYGAAQFIALSFMVVSLCIALAYMYSQLRHDPAMGVWAKDEAFNLMVSVALFAGLLVFFSGACSIAVAYTQNQTGASNPFAASQNYIDRLLASNGRDVLMSLTADSLENQKDATAYMYWGLTPFYGTGVAGSAGWRAMSAHKEFVIDLYLPMIASLNAQKYILQMLQWAGASLLLPFAFIMRLVPPTREFGNVMIAVFFGIYIIVPTMYAMSGAAFEQIVGCKTCQVSGVNSFYSFGLDGRVSGPRQDAMFYRIGSTIPQAVFLPNLVLIVTITCITSLSKALRAMAV